jgi:hypothetical protein
MDPAYDATARYSAVRLGNVHNVPEIVGDFCTAKAFQEGASFVPVNLRGEDPGTLNAQWFHAAPNQRTVPCRRRASRQP